MSDKSKIKACHGVGSYVEPIGVGRGGDMTLPINTRIGYVPACHKCRKPVGGVRMDDPQGDKRLIALQKLFTEESWALMMDVHPWPPYKFTVDLSGVLVPETYVPGAPAKLKHPVTSAQAMELAESDREEYVGEED